MEKGIKVKGSISVNEIGGVHVWWKYWKGNIIVKGIVRWAGHLFGIYTVDEYIETGRKIVKSKGVRKYLLQIKQRKIGNLRSLSIENFSDIGENLCLPHGLNIVINNAAQIGRNCTIYQGVTLGIIHEGKRAGVPKLEDGVEVCPNAVIVGRVTIGHDSLIAANAFVNFDVPPFSLVIGNPAVIHKRQIRKDEKDIDL